MAEEVQAVDVALVVGPAPCASQLSEVQDWLQLPMKRCNGMEAERKTCWLSPAPPCPLPPQVQCHSYTGYCWCVTANGRPISGTAVAHKMPRCPGRSSWLLWCTPGCQAPSGTSHGHRQPWE